MSSALKGAVAVVTGGGRGIGQATALRLAAEGARVAVLGRHERPLGETVGQIAFGGGVGRHYVCDVRDPAAVDSTFERIASDLGPVRIAVANAGLSRRTAIEDGSGDLMREIVETNLLGAMWTFRAARRHLDRDAVGGCRWIALTSVLGRFGVGGYSAYCASKHGVIGLVRALAVEVAATGTTVNAVCPGWTDTDMAATGLQDIAAAEGITPAEARARAESLQPQGRFAEPEEIARLIAFLAHPESRSITAQVYTLDNGATPF